MSRDAEVQALLDKQAITEVIARYSRTLDWLDDEGQASCYWPEAAIDYGFFKGSAADFVPAVMEIERGSQRRWHFLGGLQIALHSASSASAECYGLATGVRNNEGVWTGNIYGGLWYPIIIALITVVVGALLVPGNTHKKDIFADDGAKR